MEESLEKRVGFAPVGPLTTSGERMFMKNTGEGKSENDTSRDSHNPHGGLIFIESAARRLHSVHQNDSR